MGHVYIYAPNTDDLSTTGLCGALLPTECTHEEIAGGMSAVTLAHPFDPMGKWKYLKRGCILSCPTRVRTTPEIGNGQVVTSVERWTVKTTATVAQRTVYTKAEKGKKKKALDPGTRVYVTQKSKDRYRFLAETKQAIGAVNEVVSKGAKKSKEPVGWIAHDALTYETTEVIPPGSDGIESIVPPWTVRPQLFRIQSVEIDTDSKTVTVYAPHISYDLSTNITNYENLDPLTALEALNGIDEGCDFDHPFDFYTDIGDRRTSFEAINISPINAMLNPDTGFLTHWGAELVRDDFELYFLHRAGRNRGTRIEYGKNLLGVTYETNDENVVTAIKPTGVKKDGELLYLTDDEGSPANYIMSPYADAYPTVRAIVQACDDCTVEKGKKGVTLDIARARMTEQVERMFTEDKVDRPDVSLTVNFLQLGDTIEYQQYKNLDLVFLYDEVPVIDKRHGIEVMTDVHRTQFDCLRERLIEIEVGNVRMGLASIYSWQVQALDCGKLIGSLPGEIIEEDSIPENKLDPDLQAALKKAWVDIDNAKDRLLETNEWLDMLETQLEDITLVVGDNSSDIAAIQLEADRIRLAVRDAEQNLAQLSIQADLIAFDLEDVEKNVNTLSMTATETASTITNMQGDISRVQQDAQTLSSTIAGVSSSVNTQISQFRQTLNSFGFRLQDTSINQDFEARIASANTVSTPAIIEPGDYTGISFIEKNAQTGFIGSGKTDSGIDTFIVGGNNVTYVGSGTALHLFASPVGPSIILNGPANTIYASRSIGSPSDRRLKTEIAVIAKGEEIFDGLRPRQYRPLSNPQTLDYGFVADDVEKLLERLGVRDATIFFSNPTTGMKGLTYQELHALTVNKIQAMEARHKEEIAALEARLAALERKGSS